MRIVADDAIPFISRVFDHTHHLTLLNHREITREKLEHTDILIVRSVTPVDEALLDGTGVKIVATPTSGVDHIDEAYLQSAGIQLINTPGCNARSVAEYVLSAIYVLARNKILQPADITVGIIGCGHVGTLVASMLAAAGTSYMLYDPPLQATGDGREFVSLKEIQTADVITLHVPLHLDGSWPTYHLVDHNFLSALKPDAVIINTSRGGVINEFALLGLLDSGKLYNVVLDVWEKEPNINQALLSKAIISTPHIAGYSLDAKYQGTRQVCEKIYELKQDDNNVSGSDTILPRVNNQLTVADSMDDAEVIQFAVLSGYDVSIDSDRFKQLSYGLEGNINQHFTEYRMNYPVRREFTNFSVNLTTVRKKCKQQLEGLGFKVSPQENNFPL